MNEHLNALYRKNIAFLQQAEVEWQEWRHEPILDFETDARVAREWGWTAQPTKSLFLRLKDGRYCVLLIHRDTRLDSKAVKDLLGSRPSIGSQEEMVDIVGCVPGAVCPFGLPHQVTLVVDRSLTRYADIMWTPGLPETTFAVAGSDLTPLVKALDNPVYWLDL